MGQKCKNVEIGRKGFEGCVGKEIFGLPYFPSLSRTLTCSLRRTLNIVSKTLRNLLDKFMTLLSNTFLYFRMNENPCDSRFFVHFSGALCTWAFLDKWLSNFRQICTVCKNGKIGGKDFEGRWRKYNYIQKGFSQ